MDPAFDPPPLPAAADPRALYLDLLKRALINSIYAEHEALPVEPQRPLRRWIAGQLARRGMRLVRPQLFTAEERREGRIWPAFAHSMVGFPRLDNLQECIEEVLASGVPGDLLEAGVWRGGATIFMRGVLKAHGVTDRRVWVADSFAGLPPPDPARYPADAGSRFHLRPQLAVPLASVRRNFERYGLLDGQVRFLPGWFRDTLPAAPIERLAVLRLDGDMYESTMDVLRHLYPRLAVGGYVIVDDYAAIEACRRAVDDYRAEHEVKEPLRTVDWTAVCWRRGA